MMQNNQRVYICMAISYKHAAIYNVRMVKRLKRFQIQWNWFENTWR